MTSRWIGRFLLALLLAAPLAAQDQTLVPTAENDGGFDDAATGCGTACESTDCTDEVGTDDGNWIVGDTNTVRETMVWSFATPTNDVDQSTNAQSMTVVVGRNDLACASNAIGNDPTYSIILVCGGVDKVTIASAVAVTAAADQIDTYTWTYTADVDCDAAGANADFKYESNRPGGPAGDRNHALLDLIKWDVTWAAAGDEMMVIGGGR